MHWTDKWIGIPFKDLNCGELAVNVYSDDFGGNLQPPEKPSRENAFSYTRAIETQIMSYVSRETQNPSDGDLVLMRASNRLSHVGIFCKIKDTCYVLHSSDVFGSSILTKTTDLNQMGYKIEAYFKWQE